MHETRAHIASSAAALRDELVPSDDLSRLSDPAVADPPRVRWHAAAPGQGPRRLRGAPQRVLRLGDPGRHRAPLGRLDRRCRRRPPVGDLDHGPASPGGGLRRRPRRPHGVAVRPVRSGGAASTAGSGSPGAGPTRTGTDHAGWIILGGMVADASGTPLTPPDVRHFVLPKGDWTIVEDSWNVMGLRGTGSKDVVIDDVFVPDHRVSEAPRMYDGSYARERRPGSPLFQMMFGLMFPAAIAAGHLRCRPARDPRLRPRRWRARSRWSARLHAPAPSRSSGWPAPRPTSTRASRTSAPSIADLYAFVDDGGEITLDQRHRFRRDQVRATGRCVEAIDRLFLHAGLDRDGRRPPGLPGLAGPPRGQHPRVQQQRADLPGVGRSPVRRADPAGRRVLTPPTPSSKTQKPQKKEEDPMHEVLDNISRSAKVLHRRVCAQRQARPADRHHGLDPARRPGSCACSSPSSTAATRRTRATSSRPSWTSVSRPRPRAGSPASSASTRGRSR